MIPAPRYPTPTPPKMDGGDYEGIEDLGRPELDDEALPALPNLEWDDVEESGVKQRTASHRVSSHSA